MGGVRCCLLYETAYDGHLNMSATFFRSLSQGSIQSLKMKRKGMNTTAEERQLAPKSPKPSAGPSTEPIPRTQLTIQRPKTSPYSSPIVTFYIGLSKREYYIPRDLLQCPEWINSCSGRAHPSIRMPTVDEDIGHVLVHYLHTGTYQTLDNIDNVTANKGCVEFKRAILAYFTAKTYGLYGLQQLAMENIKHYGMELNAFDIFDMINQEFPEFLEKSGWLYDYLKEKAKAAFEGDFILLVQSDILHRISNVELNRILFKGVVELYIASRTSKNKVDCIEDGPSGEALVDEALVNAVERKKKEEGAETERMKRQEKEAVAAALVATCAANDLSWADPPAEAAPADDGWGSFTPAATVGKKKKGKKGKVTETVPLPPTGPELEPHTADPATTFDNNDLDGGVPASGLDGLGTWTSGIGSGWGAKTTLASGWGFDSGSGLGSKEEEENKDEAPWDSTEKNGKKESSGSGFDFNFDAFNDPITNSDPTGVEEKAAEDDGWGFGFGSKKMIGLLIPLVTQQQQ
ncbi:hypothetical protein K505DRAFT_150992 [Melanomma pulvis-pyrius CBS 109.77]|uniref:BTB domain-containing protein n=1 Tax=Melanomma pulvis-pyrius CBS 109.77 TaxID=1314802 RepID=A0A6A6WQT5_9PLEO|nr:hypothetical protein K505DRAFT_150992 [Melanomma pulvis-pyrius CBS 109.77]